MKFHPTQQKIRVSHYPQIPCKPFTVEVNNEREAFLLQEVLSDQHLFLYSNGFIPDFSNAITIEVFVIEENEWQDYFNEFHDTDWESTCEDFISEINPLNP